MGRPTVAQGARHWRRVVGAAMAKGRPMPPDRYLEVRYEAFVAEPGPASARILAFLEEPPEPLLGYVETVTDASRADRWRELLSADDVQVVEGICGDLMEELGYEFAGADAGAGAGGAADGAGAGLFEHG